MDAKHPRKHEAEEPEYVDEAYPQDSDIDPWSEGQAEERLKEEARAESGPPQEPDVPDREILSPPARLSGQPSESGRRPRPGFSPNFVRRASPASGRPARQEVAEPTGRPEANPARPEQANVPVLPPPEPPAPEPVQATILPAGNSLETLIEAHQPLPPGSLVLGVDDAGKPLVFALDDPSLGSLLFMADDAGANRKHLGAVLASAALLTEPDLLQIDVISPDPAAFKSESSNVRQVCAPGDDCVYGLLGDVLTLMERRLRDARMLPFQLLVLDEIDLLVEGLAEDSLRFLRWILRRGPQVGIWLLASIASDRLEAFDRKTFRAFGFHLYGRMAQPTAIARYVRVPAHLLKRLAPGSQGYLKLEKDNIAFSIPATS